MVLGAYNRAKHDTSAPLCLITRPEPDASRFAARVEAELGLRVLVSPLLRMHVTQVSVQVDRFAGVILTSAAAARLLPALGIPKALPCYAVGEKTAQTAQELGYSAQAMGGDGDRLVAALSETPPPTPLLHLRGEHSRGDVAARLTSQGIETEEKVVYQQIAQDLTGDATTAIAGKDPIVLPLFSPRTAALASQAMLGVATIHPVALSTAVAEAFGGDAAAQIATAARPTEDDMLHALASAKPVQAWVEKCGLQS